MDHVCEMCCPISVCDDKIHYRPIQRRKPFDERKSYGISANVTYDIYAFIKTMAASKNITMAELFRIILQEYYEAHKNEDLSKDL